MEIMKYQALPSNKKSWKYTLSKGELTILGLLFENDIAVIIHKV
jgi:hypothetical protein